MNTSQLIYQHIENIYKKQSFTYDDLEDLVFHGIKIGLNEQIQNGESSLWHNATSDCKCDYCEKSLIYKDIKEILDNLIYCSISEEIEKKGFFHISTNTSSKCSKLSKKTEAIYNIKIKKVAQTSMPNFVDVVFSFTNGLVQTTLLRSLPIEFSARVDLGHSGGEKTFLKKFTPWESFGEISYLSDTEFASVDIQILRNFYATLPS